MKWIDENNEITNGQDYLPLGSIFREYNIASTNEKYDFTEKERDTETGLNYFGARYYDSDLGRWTSVDPLAHLRHGLSQYQYAQNNPLLRIDPTGMLDEWFEDENGDIKYKENVKKQYKVLNHLRKPENTIANLQPPTANQEPGNRGFHTAVYRVMSAPP